jgi:CBS domain containing-hemolysin-like protein
MAKDLILCNPDSNSNLTIKQLSPVLREITQFPGNYTCDTVLEHFQRGHSHIAFIVEIV